MTGAQYKALLPRVLARRQENGRAGCLHERAHYDGRFEGEKSPPTATPSLKCCTDKHFSLRVERQSDGSYLIIEERGEARRSRIASAAVPTARNANRISIIVDWRCRQWENRRC